jgi:ABC-type sugar transport system permease subunit
VATSDRTVEPAPSGAPPAPDEQVVAPPPERGTAAPTRTVAQRDARFGQTLLAPTLLIVVVIVVLPILWTVVLAFQRLRLVDLHRRGLLGAFTLDNIGRVFGSPGFWTALRTTLLFSVVGTVASIGLGLVAALALRGAFPGRVLVRASMLLPYVAPVVAVTFVWKIMLSPQYGIVNHWGTGILGWDHPIAFLSQRESTVFGVPVPTALLTVVAFEGWRYFPFAFLFLTARLVGLPKDIEEAAVVDGVTPWQNFRFIVLPQLLPVIALLSVLRLIMTFNKFDDVYLLTGGAAGTEVSAVRVYDTLIGSFDIGGAAANAFVLSAILGVFLFIYVKFFAGKGDDE